MLTCNLLSAKNLLPPHASSLRQKAHRCTPEDWIRDEGRFQVQVEGILSQLGEECPVAGGLCTDPSVCPSEAGLCVQGSSVPSSEVKCLSCFVPWLLEHCPFQDKAPQGRRIEKY